ncbi:MAG TPA: diaminopropionate ammonia-lyase [Candidatus Limnocylindrales bacterium]|nr:diaminopropionate ammonia-lyase [Candidatus Limnocylindrales bacterium]
MPTSRSSVLISPSRSPAFRCPPPPPGVPAFHRSLEGYAPTPLVPLPAVVERLGVARVYVKDESSRLGLPAFKALGASWAMRRTLDELGWRAGDAPLTFVTATDGNHGRAVARTARLLGHRARVLVPDGVHPAAIAAIEAEGAAVTHVPGSYDDAVAEAARVAAGAGAVLLQDTAWPGYERIPALIVEGYATLFAELDEQLAAAGVAAPDLVVVPVGVGSLAQAAVGHYRSRADPARTSLVSAEPTVAACALESLRAGEPVTVETSPTIMAGLNAGTLSSLAWPLLHAGLDAAVAVTDDEARAAAPALAAAGVAAGPCGWAALAAARVALAGEDAAATRAALRIDAGSVVVVVATEGIEANPAS